MQYELYSMDKCENYEVFFYHLSTNSIKAVFFYIYQVDTEKKYIIVDNYSVIELTDDTGLEDLTNDKLYVLNADIKTALENEANYVAAFGKDNIRLIIEMVGDSPVHVPADDTYMDDGVLVSGADSINANEYMQYGFILETTGLPLDTTIPGEYEVVYTLKFGEIYREPEIH